jgi:Flp pilus assembly protein TadD
MSDQLQKAHEHRISGQYPEAIASYREILDRSPDDAEACWGLATALMNQGEFEDCVVYFEKAVDLARDNSEYLYHLAMFHTMLGEYELAKPLFDKIILLDNHPKYVGEARKQLAYL